MPTAHLLCKILIQVMMLEIWHLRRITQRIVGLVVTCLPLVQTHCCPLHGILLHCLPNMAYLINSERKNWCCKVGKLTTEMRRMPCSVPHSRAVCNRLPRLREFYMSWVSPVWIAIGPSFLTYYADRAHLLCVTFRTRFVRLFGRAVMLV